MKSLGWKKGMVLLGVVILMCLSLAACGPNEQERVALAEQKRIECSDKICHGDVEPKRDWATEVALKLNGQWYVGPKEYFSSVGRADFEWWEHKPVSRAAQRTSEMQALAVAGRGYDFSIEIFLTGRQRWHASIPERPWEAAKWEDRWAEIQAQNMRMEKTKIRADLERISFVKSDGTFYRMTYYQATARTRIRGEGWPVAACDSDAHESSRCTAGEFWQPDVYADFRFNSKHAQDWPAIHQEIVRVLNLLQRVQP